MEIKLNKLAETVIQVNEVSKKKMSKWQRYAKFNDIVAKIEVSEVTSIDDHDVEVYKIDVDPKMGINIIDAKGNKVENGFEKLPLDNQLSLLLLSENKAHKVEDNEIADYISDIVLEVVSDDTGLHDVQEFIKEKRLDKIVPPKESRNRNYLLSGRELFGYGINTEDLDEVLTYWDLDTIKDIATGYVSRDVVKSLEFENFIREKIPTIEDGSDDVLEILMNYDTKHINI